MTIVSLTVLSSNTEYVYTQEGQMNAFSIHVEMVKSTHLFVTLRQLTDQSLLKLVVLRMELLFLFSALGSIAKEGLVKWWFLTSKYVS